MGSIFRIYGISAAFAALTVSLTEIIVHFGFRLFGW